MRYTAEIELDLSKPGRDVDFAVFKLLNPNEYKTDEEWNKRYWYGDAPLYSTDLNVTCLVEDGVNRCGLLDRYVAALCALCGVTGSLSTNPIVFDLWDIARVLRTTPYQRCMAAVKVLA